MTNTHRYPANKLHSLASIISMLCIMLLLAACQTASISHLSGSGEHRVEQLVDNGRHQEAASAYIRLAANATGNERDRLTLLAIEQWLDAGEVKRAERVTANVQIPTYESLLPIWNTNLAALSLYRGNADAALQLLEPYSRRLLPLRDRLRIEMLRADAWIQKQNPARAIELMSHRETWLSSSKKIRLNRSRLWQGLLYSNPQVLRKASQIATNKQTRGWLTLGSLATSTGQQGIGWNHGIFRWRLANPGHPALAIIGESESFDQELLNYPRKVALLLPLSGHSAAAGKAIQHGFLGGYFATAAALDNQQSLRIYDVNAEGGASAAYQKAVENGAEFVIGPLLKNNVTELANKALIPVPVLTLNYLPDDASTPPNLYQFALAPEDEAASAAYRILGDGYTRAVALVPNNDWGRRTLQSFITEFEGLGGTLLDYRSYTLDKQDFSNEIESLMGLSGSVKRYQRLRENIGGSLEFDPRRRQDTEFIFLAAAAGPGRLLKSQLKFHYSGDLPVYSTSSVNSLDGRSDSDLNGIMFTDIPWLISPQPWIRYLPEIYNKHWPEERRLGRLHAMGYDAYNLIASLFANHDDKMGELSGATGNLFLDRQGRVHRRLAWAQFQRGKAIALPNQEKVSGPIQNTTDDGIKIAPAATDESPWGGIPQQLEKPWIP